MGADRSKATYCALSSSQMNIWNAERAFSGTSVNTICTTVRIQGAVDIAALQKSLDLLMREEPQLRARIGVADGKPYQYIAPYEHRLFPVFDFTKTDSMGLAHWEDMVAREPIPLIDAPLNDFRIFRQSEAEGGIVVKTHHIVSDGWSQVLLSNRLAETYLALISNREARVQAGPAYALHVEKEQAYLSARAHERDGAFWRERLQAFDGASAVKECHAAVVSPVGRRKTYRLSHMLNHLIHDFCDKYRVAPFAVYYMALAIYLNRTSGASRTAIGVPVFNRADYEDKNTLGMFVSTLPFLGTVDENWSFARFNEELTEQWFELLRHQKLPFSEIAALSKEINPDSGRLFHIVLSYQTSRIYRSGDALVSFSGRWHYSGYQSEHLLIHLSSMEDDYRFSVDYDYLTQIFSERDIDRLHEYLTNILTSALSEPELPIWRLPVIGMEEKGRVLFAFNQTSRPLPYADVPCMLRAAARENPQRVAVIAGGKRLTYGALMGLASSYARAIDALCPAGNGTVAICLEKGFSLAAAVAAAALSGNAWLTLPPDTPSGRLNEILIDSGACVLVCEPDAVPPGCTVPVLEPEKAKLYDSAPYPDKPSSDTAYIVYTSGSTGRPKGVLVGQENLVNLAMAVRRLYGHGAVLSLCSTGFDVFVMECAVALMNARTIVFAASGQQEDPAALASLIRDYAVGNLSLPPSRLEAYLREEKFARALAGVESIVCGGEPFPGELMQALRLHTEAAVYNQYGPSETTVAVSCKQLNDASAITIGAPMDNCRFYVLDAHMQPLPVGVYGELYIGGLCVGQGYRNLPELTRENFLQSPFELGERLYRSGDIGCWTNDGEIRLGGRCDGQVKLRGLRIEPQEIAMRLAAHEKVHQAAARVVSRGKAGFIAAYYTADEFIPEAELTAFLRLYLPAYMLPGAYVRLEELPATRSGKVDYLALPEPELVGGGEEAQNATEAALLAVFQKTLAHADMDVESDYFLFGGDSLTAMEAIVAIEAALGVKLSVADLYAYRSARKMAAFLAGRIKEDPCAPPAPIPVATDRMRYPATPTQVSLYFESQRDPAALAYNMPGAFRLPGNADRARLLEAFRSLIACEKLLRTSFEIDRTGLVQRVSPNAAFGIGVLGAASFEEASAEFVKPFDVTRPPLMRAAFWDAPGGESWLFFDTHHLIGDGLTSPLMMKKLDAFYAGRVCAPGVGYCDYALWRAERGENEAARAFWRERLAHAPEVPDLPLDRREGGHSPYPGGKIDFALDRETAALAEAYCKKNDVSPFMLFMAAYALLLNKLTGEEDLIIGAPVSGRTAPELWEVCGPFIRTLPLRLRLGADMSAARLVQEVRRETLSMLEHQDASLEELLRAARGEAGGRLFNALFSMRPIGEGDFSFLGEALHPVPIDTGWAKFPLSLEAAKAQGGYAFTLEYASSLIDRESAALWARSYRALVGAMLRADDAPLAQIDPLDPADRYELFDKPDRLAVPFADIPLDFTIAHTARRVPHAPAVRFHGETTSYAALLRRAGGIARALVSRGAARGDVIGLVHERTPDLFAALLGIMMAGCVYMPALASYPAKRLAYMAETAEAKLILADDRAAKALDQTSLPCPVVPLTSLEEDAHAPLPTLPARRGEDGIYILFTSGTTGNPKGALNTHAAIANLFEAVAPIIGPQAKTVLCSTNVTFDIFITESLLALALGKCVALADEEEMLLPHELARLIETERVDVMQLTPSRLQMCLSSAAFASAASRLGAMLVAGEPLPRALAERFHGVSPARLFNLYGPTEATVYASYAPCPPGLLRITIGRPLPNCRMYLLDVSLRRVPPTARGEIYIAGACLSRGYIGEPELTAASFIEDPFFPGGLMYRSGDYGRLLSDGNIEYLGRRDAQVKINGQRVELAEIKVRLIELAGVAEAEVVLIGEAGAEKRLRACVVPKPGAELREQALRDALAATLPPFMVPGEIWLLSALPRNASGKADVRAIASARAPVDVGGVPKDIAAPAKAPEDAPAPEAAGDVAGVLASIWRAVLGREEIDPRRSFFEQGGGSLSALEAISRYYNEGFTVTLAQFYENPVLEAQAALLTGRSPENRAPRQPDEPERAHAEVEAAQGEQTIKAPRQASFPAAEPAEAGRLAGAVLLTGATGFLGAHLLDELVRMGREVVCVVRGDPARLEAVMEEYFGAPWYAAHAPRVRALTGDILKPDFGLAAEEVRALTGRVGTLLHCAADVRHFTADPHASVDVNAGGTANAVRLAAKLGAELAYVSTMSVMGENPRDIFDEGSLPADPEGEKNIYVRGKCAAELLVRRCARLLPAARILRVGRLVGRERDGMFQKNPESNAFFRFLKGALALEKYPRSLAEYPLELTPVDACARAVALLLDARESTCHVFNPEFVPFAEVVGAIKGDAVFVADEEFAAYLARRMEERPSPELIALREVWDSLMRGEPQGARMSAARTAAELGQRGFAWSAADARIVLARLAAE